MAVEVTWSEAALGDVSDIAEFITRDSFRYAQAMVERIFESVESLQRFPNLGRILPERNDERYRDLIVRPYRVIYRVRAGGVDILAVIHGARLLEPAVGRRLPEAH